MSKGGRELKKYEFGKKDNSVVNIDDIIESNKKEKSNIFREMFNKKTFIIIFIIVIMSILTITGVTYVKSTSLGLHNTYTGKVDKIEDDYILLNDMKTLDIKETSEIMKKQNYIELDISNNSKVKKLIKDKDIKVGDNIRFETAEKIKITEDYPPRIIKDSIKEIYKSK